MLSVSPIPMKFSVRADLFGQLAAMEDAGLPFDKVLEILRLPPNEEARRHAMRKWIRRGLGIADAGERSGLFTALEASLVRAATSSGSPGRTYRLIAEQCTRRAARIKAMKSRMILPATIVAISIMLGPVPKLAAGYLTLTAYLAKYVLPWIGVAVTLHLLRDFLRRHPGAAHSSRVILLHRILTLVPLFGPMEVRRNLRDFYDGLALLLEAGVTMLEALPLALDTVRNQALRSQLARIRPLIEAGSSFWQAIAVMALFGRAPPHGLIRTGEESGALPRVLSRHSQAESAAIDRFDDLMAEWIPRLAYTSAALLAGYSVIHSGAFMPSLPQELR